MGLLSRVLLLFAALGALARAQFTPGPSLQIQREPCADCEEASIELSWQGNWALDESVTLLPNDWALAEQPVLVNPDGSRSVVYHLQTGMDDPTQRFFHLREFEIRMPALFTSKLDVEDVEAFNDPPAVQLADEPRVQLPRAQPIYQIRLRAVRTANSDGSQAAVITPEEVALFVHQANAVYWTAGIEFLFDPDRDFEIRNSTPLNHDFVVLGDLSSLTDPDVKPPEDFVSRTASATLRTAVADERPDAITIFFRWGDKFKFSPREGHWELYSATGGFSAWSGSYVAMPAYLAEKNLLAHELGHYLHNGHPFVNGISTVRQAADFILKAIRAGLPVSEGLNALDGDRSWVLDTPPDCRAGIYLDAGLDPGDPAAPPIPIPVSSPSDGVDHTYYLQPDHRHNIMSYFKHYHDLGHWLTPQMIERLRDGLENGLRQRLLGKTRPSAVIQLQEEGHAGEPWIAADFEIVRTRYGQLVTAIRTDAGRIRLIAWHVDDDGNITRKGSIESTGTATELTAENLGLGLVATAFRSETGTLKVIVWQVDPDGSWERRGQAEYSLPGFGPGALVGSLSTTRMGVHYLVTGARSVARSLYLVVWRTYANGEITRVTTTGAGNCLDLSLSPAGRANQVFSSLTTRAGNLRVAAWRLEENQLIQTSQLDAGGVGEIESAYLDLDLNSSIVRIPSTGDLKIIDWNLSETSVLTRSGDDTHRPVNARDRAFSASRLGVDLLGVAQVNPRNMLEVGVWRITDAGVTISNEATVTSIPALQVQTEQVGRGNFAVAARTTLGALDLRIWKVRKLIPLPGLN